MKAERVTLTPAFLLHHHAWRETSRMLEVWSREYGRIGLVARGVRRPRSPYRSLLQPFTPLVISWSQRSELGSFTGAEAGGWPAALTGRPLMAGFYMNELLLRLLPRQDPHPELYDRYAATLRALDQPRPASALRVFEKNLLEALGYGLNLTHAVPDGKPVEAGKQYIYDLESGPRAVMGHRSSGLVLPGRVLLALHAEALDDAEDLRAVKRLLRAALERHLDGRRLKSAVVMRALSKGV
ncbi:MAG: DNA repair protein RecO [Bacillota bacterium]